MAKFLVIIELVLLVYCLIDCIQTDPADVRTLPKPLWAVLIIVLPLFGGVGWLLAGKPERGTVGAGRTSSWPAAPTSEARRPNRSAPLGPDDDPDFLRSLHPDAEHEQELKRWEDDLRERERKLRDGEQPPDRPSDAPS
jgi:hypothetical protein